MVHFTVSEEQLNLPETTRDFAEKRSGRSPGTTNGTGHGRRHRQRLRGRPDVLEADGRAGTSSLEGCLIAEELPCACAGVATTLEANGLASAPLPASFCLTEPHGGPEVSGMETTAVRKGDNWVTSGSNVFINGEYANWYTATPRLTRRRATTASPGSQARATPGVIVNKHEETWACGHRNGPFQGADQFGCRLR